MKMEKIKGLIDRIAGNKVVVIKEKTGEECFFSASELVEAFPGEKVDILASLSDEDSAEYTVIAVKSRKKVKPLKMPNFNTLVGHMIKTRDRLKATIAESDDSESQSDLKEKIAWLDRGISLFS